MRALTEQEEIDYREALDALVNAHHALCQLPPLSEEIKYHLFEARKYADAARAALCLYGDRTPSYRDVEGLSADEASTFLTLAEKVRATKAKAR